MILSQIESGVGGPNVLQLWNSRPGNLVLATNDAEKVRIDNTGNVGIGTTVPGERLSVAGAIESTSGGFKFPDGSLQTTAATGEGTGDGHSLDAADGDPVDAIYVANDGNVGIGTTKPENKLEVNGIARFLPTLQNWAS